MGGGASTRDNVVEIFMGNQFGYRVKSWDGIDLQVEIISMNLGLVDFIGVKNAHPAWYRLTYETDDEFKLRGNIDNFYENFKIIKENRQFEYRFRYTGKQQLRFEFNRSTSFKIGDTFTLRNLKIIELKDENEEG